MQKCHVGPINRIATAYWQHLVERMAAQTGYQTLQTGFLMFLNKISLLLLGLLHIPDEGLHYIPHEGLQLKVAKLYCAL